MAGRPFAQVLPEHGTRARYQRGCRCPRCTEDGNNAYMRAYRSKWQPTWTQLHLPGTTDDH